MSHKKNKRARNKLGKKCERSIMKKTWNTKGNKKMAWVFEEVE